MSFGFWKNDLYYYFHDNLNEILLRAVHWDPDLCWELKCDRYTDIGCNCYLTGMKLIEVLRNDESITFPEILLDDKPSSISLLLHHNGYQAVHEKVSLDLLPGMPIDYLQCLAQRSEIERLRKIIKEMNPRVKAHAKGSSS